MSLGKLYRPSGKALEHAKAVLEVDKPYAVNIAEGCSIGCSYCYGPSSTFQSEEDWLKIRNPDGDPFEMVKSQVENGTNPKGVFMSFLTEPLLPNLKEKTEKIAEYLVEKGIRVAVSSKLDTISVDGIRHGMTIVSLDEGFWKKYEENAPNPRERVALLEEKADEGEYTWISMEPCPCSNIWEQDIAEVLEELKFVDFIIKGKWNYNKEATTEDMKEEYKDIFWKFDDFCERYGIRHHTKKKTREWLEDRNET